MDIKLIDSKINLLKAQKAQLADCGFFSEIEITKLSKPMDEGLKHYSDLKTIAENGSAVSTLKGA